MREILPGIYTWGATYPDRPWELNGYAVELPAGTVLVDPPAPSDEGWRALDALKPITHVVLTNRDHTRDADLFRARYQAPLIASSDELRELAPLGIDTSVRDGDLIANALQVIHVPGKSPGEIALLLNPEYHDESLGLGGVLFVGDAIIGHPPGALGLIPAHKIDDNALLRRSLRKLLNYKFGVLLLCDGEPVLQDAKRKLAQFITTLA